MARSLEEIEAQKKNFRLKEERRMSEEVKYDNHAQEWENVLSDDEGKGVGLAWLEGSNTLDSWRHDRMLKHLAHL